MNNKTYISVEPKEFIDEEHLLCFEQKQGMVLILKETTLSELLESRGVTEEKIKKIFRKYSTSDFENGGDKICGYDFDNVTKSILALLRGDK